MLSAQSTGITVSKQVSPDGWFTGKRFLLIMCGLVVLWFPAVAAGTSSFFFRDFGTLGYPFIHYHREAFWRHELPLWNPLSNCGAPFLAQWNTLVLYPLSLIYLLLPLPWSLNYFCLAHLVLGGLGMYLLARGWVRNTFAASVAGISYAFSGLMLSSHIYANYLVTLGWMPFTVWFAERAWREGGRTILVAALAGAMQMLSGAPELILQTWLVIIVLGLSEWLPRFRGSHWARASLLPAVKGPLRFIAAVLLVAAFAAAQLLPFFGLLSHSQRGPAYAGQLWTMPGWGWASLLVPLFHCFTTPQGVMFQSGQAFVVSYYLGGGVTALALWACLRCRDRRVWVLGGLALLGLVLALGENGHLYGWLREWFPIIGVVRFPIKFVYIVAFTVPLLAAYACANLSDPTRGWTRDRRYLTVLVLGFLVLMAGIVLFGWRYPFPGEDWRITLGSAGSRFLLLTAIVGLVGWRNTWRHGIGLWLVRLAVLAAVWLDAPTHQPRLTPVITHSVYRPRVTEVEPMPRYGVSRVILTSRAETLLMTRTLPDFEKDFLGARLAAWANLNVLEGIPKVTGASTLQVRQEAEIESLLYAAPSNSLGPMLRFLGVSHVSSPVSPVEWTPVADFMPLATIGQAPVFADDQETVRGLFSPVFEPRNRVYLPIEAKTQVQAVSSPNARILGRHIGSHRLEFETDSERPTMLVVAQSCYPCWQALVDDRPARIWRANHAFQAVEVAPGRHRVRLIYRDSQFRLGAWISALALVGSFAALWQRAPAGKA